MFCSMTTSRATGPATLLPGPSCDYCPRPAPSAPPAHHPTQGTPESPRPPRPTSPPPASPRPVSPSPEYLENHFPNRCPRQCCLLVHRHRCRDEPCPRRHRAKHPLLGVARHGSLPKLLQFLAALGILVHESGSASSIHRSCRPASSKSSRKIGWRRGRLHWHARMGFTMRFSRRPSRSSLRQLQAIFCVLMHRLSRLRLSSHRRRSDAKPLDIMRLPMVGASHLLPTGLLRPSRFPGVCSLRSGHQHHRGRPQPPTMVPGQQPSGAAVLHLPRLLRPSRRPATRGLRLRVLWHPP